MRNDGCDGRCIAWDRLLDYADDRVYDRRMRFTTGLACNDFSNTKVSYSPHDLCIVSDHLGDHVFCTYLLFYLGKTMCGEKSVSLKIDNKIG